MVPLADITITPEMVANSHSDQGPNLTLNYLITYQPLLTIMLITIPLILFIVILILVKKQNQKTKIIIAFIYWLLVIAIYFFLIKLFGLA